LPNGLDSIVGRSGVRLSGGQRQRLAIARMVLAEPKVVILDEATSALDAATEYNLHQALARFLSGRTTLIIAHRLSAVKQADRVLVFDGGQIAEDGDHQQLIADGGLYAKLYGHLQQHPASLKSCAYSVLSVWLCLSRVKIAAMTLLFLQVCTIGIEVGEAACFGMLKISLV
jgi:ABC-type transport system involved in cytochrome bd biosynthesis fused ATPase/permease subunit